MHSALIKLLCVTLAFVGIAGTHEHLAIAGEHRADHHEHGIGHAEDGGHAVETFSAFDAHHAETHAGGDVDIDPAAKAPGKIPFGKLSLAIAFIIAGISFLAPTGSAYIRRGVRDGPPRAQTLFSLLPPSQAPPRAAFAR